MIRKNEIEEIKLDYKDYNMAIYIHNLQANNECRLSFSHLPELTEKESFEYFNKNIITYLDTLFFCRKILNSLSKLEEFQSVDMEKSTYYVSLKEGSN